MKSNITPHLFEINRDDRIKILNQNPKLIWFTGLSGSGKSTLANAVEKELNKKKFSTYILDGDNIRNGINSDLDFTQSNRNENIRRIAEIAKLMLDAGLIVCSAFVSPTQQNRDLVKSIVGKNDYIEIYVSTPLSACEKRDVKGLYKKARKGEILNFTGISADYEKPNNPDIIINTENLKIHDATKIIIQHILPKIL